MHLFFSRNFKIHIFFQSQIRDCYFCRALNLTSFSFFRIAFWFKTVLSENVQTFAAFGRKMVEHDVTKTQFSQKYVHGFSITLIEDVKLMPDKALKVLHQYLLSFLSYPENTGGG